MPKLFDTHCHVNFPDFNDQDEVIKRSADANIWMTNVGCDFNSSKSAVELADKLEEGVYATVGLHPTDSKESFDEEKYSELISPKVVAIGECGLDYYRLEAAGSREQEIAKQKSEFIKQIHFAQKHSLPLVIHCRDLPSPELRQAGAYEDLLSIMKSEFKGQAIIHSFTDSWETAKKFLDLGYCIAFNGIVFFDKSGKLAEVVKNMPSDRILTETDAPFLAPPPHRGKRNEPSYVKFVAEKIAEIRGEDFEKVSEYTFNNALKIYGIRS
jgi:TatD DNase family protein